MITFFNAARRLSRVAGALDWLDPQSRSTSWPRTARRSATRSGRHWMASVFPALRLALGLWLFATAWLFTSLLFWVLLAGVAGPDRQGPVGIADQFRDRFVVTNQKVYRVHGNVNQVRASMPLTRILDITVDRPLVGRIFGYGHFVFESAAQDQGLRDIRGCRTSTSASD